MYSMLPLVQRSGKMVADVRYTSDESVVTIRRLELRIESFWTVSASSMKTRVYSLVLTVLVLVEFAKIIDNVAGIGPTVRSNLSSN